MSSFYAAEHSLRLECRLHWITGKRIFIFHRLDFHFWYRLFYLLKNNVSFFSSYFHFSFRFQTFIIILLFVLSRTKNRILLTCRRTIC
jgi:hypothetical protein